MAFELCKIKYDGNCYLASPYINKNKYYFANEIIQMNNNDERLDGLNKKEYFYNLWAKEKFGDGRKGKSKREIIEKLNNEILLIYLNLSENEELKKEDIVKIINDTLINDVELMEKISNIPAIKENLENYIKYRLNAIKENVVARRRRFKNKAYSNDWNYFVTFTYDNVIMYELSTKEKWKIDDGNCDRKWEKGLKYIEENKEKIEELFKKKLTKKLQDLHTRNNWNYMGVWEKGTKNERLHFHCFINIPTNKEIGIFRDEKRFNKETKTIDKIYINSYFENKFGRNDFEKINNKSSETFSRELDYIIKYITKSNDKIIYSRGLKDYDFAVVEFEKYKICKLSEESPYYILSDNFIDNSIFVDKELNLKQIAA